MNKLTSRFARSFFGCLGALALVACGGGGGGGSSNTNPAPATYSVTANVSGLSGSGLVLALGSGSNVNVTGNGSVTLESGLSTGAAYSVTIDTQPIKPVQTCSLTGSSGKVSGANADVAVLCVAGNASTVNAAKSTVTIDSSIPTAAQSAVANVISSIDSQPLHSALNIPISFVGGETLVFAVDANNNILLAALATQPNITLSASSTALALTRMALGALPSTLTAADLNSGIQATADFPSLVSAVLTSLTTGNSLITSASVSQAIFRVISEIPAQYLSAFTDSASDRGNIKASPVTQPSLSSAPFDLISKATNPSIAGALTVVGATSSGGLTIKNTTPLVWTFSSTDTSNNPLCAPGYSTTANSNCAVTIDSSSLTDLLQENLALNLFEPSNSPIGGNGTAFNITAYQGVTALTANVIQIDEDLLSAIAAFATDGAVTPSCIDQTASALFPPASIASIAVQLANGGLAGASPAINSYLKTVFGLKNALKLFNAVITCGAAIDVPPGTQPQTFWTAFEVAYAGFLQYLTGSGSGNAYDFLNGGGLAMRLAYVVSFAGYSKTFGVCEINTSQTYTVSDCTASLSFSPSSVTLVPTTQYTLQPQALDINGGNTLSPNDLIFTSAQAPSIIELDAQTGAVTAQPLGGATNANATVTATSNSTGINASYTINVNSQPLMTLISVPQSVDPLGGTITLLVSITPPTGAVNSPAFNGTVTFSDTQSGVLCSDVTVSSGAASCSPPSPVVPPDYIRANFMNDTVYAPASASTTVTSSGATPTTLTLVASPMSLPSSGGSATFTATVTPQSTVPSGTPAPTGTMTFADTTGATFCTQPVAVTAGAGTCTALITAVPDTVAVKYSGDQNYQSSTASLTISAATPSLTLVPAASNVTFTLTDAGISGDSGPISGPGSANLSCAAPCSGFSAAGASYSNTASYTDVWSLPGGGTQTNSSTLQGALSFTTGANATFTSTGTWTVVEGGSFADLSGAVDFIITSAYTVSVTSNCSLSYGSVTSGTCTGGAPSAQFLANGITPIAPSSGSGNNVQYTLPAGTYVLDWALVQDTYLGCCAVFPKPSSASGVFNLSASFQPSQ
jgi:hypothetical protein